MSTINDLEYTYGGKIKRIYNSADMDKYVLKFMKKEFNKEYNVCFLNYYKNEKNI